MDLQRLIRISDYEWHIKQQDDMHVPGILYADEELIRAMDDKVYEQVINVAMLPGIVRASLAMPDAHWGYGFPIGGVSAFDPELGGVISAGGVGFDISCGVRSLLTGLTYADIEPVKKQLADLLFASIPAGLGSRGDINLSDSQMDDMLLGGARWAVDNGWGELRDLERIEERGVMAGADPDKISARARHRQQEEMGTLGSGNHYLEVQLVKDIYAPEIAETYGLQKDHIVVSIHCGSRGLGHQVGTEYLKEMAMVAKQTGLFLPDRELACAPINSAIGLSYLGAMRAGVNCALANRQIITHLTREVFADLFPRARLDILYDVSHNTCKEEVHEVDGKQRRLFVHRKGATRAFGPGHDELPEIFQETGQPVLIGGSMGTESYVLAGIKESEAKSFSSACHGAGRTMSRHAARKQWYGRQVIDELAARGILIRSHSGRGIAEEAPHAYKDVSAVVNATHAAGLARKIARLTPLVCVKG
jgi:tRNA-splicing ligase RtcB (3'-phosphate/5'-hydroxy nucleic acid ligase)